MKITKSKSKTNLPLIIEQPIIEIPVIMNEVPVIEEIIEIPVIMNEVIDNVVESIIEVPVMNFVDNLIKQIDEATQINNVVINQNVLITKAHLGRIIFEEELLNGLSRSKTINRLMVEANLTKAGASTYFQNMKKKAGLVVSRV